MKRWRPMQKSTTPPPIAKAIQEAQERGEDVQHLVKKIPPADAIVRTLADGGELRDVRPVPPIDEKGRSTEWELGEEIQIVGAKWENVCIAVVTEVGGDGTFTIRHERDEE